MTDLARLSITVDSKSARTAAADLQKLGAVSEAVQAKVTRMCKGIAEALKLVGFKNAIAETTLLAAMFDTLGAAMTEKRKKMKGYFSRFFLSSSALFFQSVNFVLCLK